MIADVFRIVNFLVLIGVAIYFLKKYGIQTFLDRIAEKEEALRALFEWYRTLMREEKRQEGLLVEDREAADRLRDKILLWKKENKKKFENEEEERKRCHTLVCKRAKRQSDLYQLQQKQKAMASIVVDEVEKEMKKKFLRTKEAQCLLDDISIFMDK